MSNSIENITNKLSDLASSIGPKAANENEVRIFESFLAELTDADDAPPTNACRDARYYLTLQREKMKSLGLTVKEEIKHAGALGEITGVSFDSPKYTGRRLFRGYCRKTKYFKGDKQIYSYKDNLVLYQMLIDAKEGISADESCLCPACGALSTIAELENGCHYCRAHFMMSELFPKVTEHFWLHDYSMTKGDMNKRFLIYILSGLAIGLAAGTLFHFAGPLLSDKIQPDITAFLTFAFMGLFGGAFASVSTLFWRVMHDAVKSVPMVSRTAGSRKKLTSVMRNYDSCFFYEAFESRVISLLKIMLYCDDLEENAVYCSDKPAPKSDVIDAICRGAMEIRNVEVSDKHLRVTLSLFADCLHLKGSKIVRQSHEYRMAVMRSLDVVTDQGFSLIKVECPSCGGSFDAARAKRCPYCDREYHLYDHDWAICSFEQIK